MSQKQQLANRPDRGLKYSLRTLFVAVTSLAAVLGFVVAYPILAQLVVMILLAMFVLFTPLWAQLLPRWFARRR